MRSIVLVTGGRTYANAALLDSALDHVTAMLGGSIAILQGGAKGADRLAKDWAIRHGCPVLTCDAPWDYYGRGRAGPIRNGWMLEVCPVAYAVAFPGGTGTADMVRKIQKAGVTLWDLRA